MKNNYLISYQKIRLYILPLPDKDLLSSVFGVKNTILGSISAYFTTYTVR